MKRTPVVLAFFLAALLLGLYVAFQAPKMETFTLANEIGSPVPKSDVYPVEEGTTGPGNVDPAPYKTTKDPVLFSFQENRKSADCCPSPFVSDEGCICLTDAQKTQFASRGGNGKA